MILLYCEGLNVIKPFTVRAKNTCIVFFFSLLTHQNICCRVFMTVEYEIQAPHKTVEELPWISMGSSFDSKRLNKGPQYYCISHPRFLYLETSSFFVSPNPL